MRSIPEQAGELVWSQSTVSCDPALVLRIITFTVGEDDRMVQDTSEGELRAGAIDFDEVEATARGLRVLLYGPSGVPIRSRFRTGTFPHFLAKSFALTEDHGNIINVWRVRDEVENYRVIGGVAAAVDKSGGYISAYQRTLDDILASDEASRRAFAVLDHVITNYLLIRREDRH